MNYRLGNEVREYIGENILLFDGAMGSLYLEKYRGRCELANINNPQAIYDIHREYIEAGCKAIKTNTFSANTIELGIAKEEIVNIIEKAVDIAIEAVGDREVFIFGDIGPISYKDDSPMEEYKYIVDTFFEKGINCFIFETLGSDDYINEICEYIRSIDSQSYIITQFAVAPDGFTALGLYGKNIIKRLYSNNAIDAIGFNCISGAHHLSNYIKQFDTSGKTFAITPNAGYPTFKDNRVVFGNSSDFFAKNIYNIVKDGVRIVGGCCGTNPEYISKVSSYINGYVPSKRIEYVPVDSEDTKSEVRVCEFLEKMNNGKKVIAVELDPPINTDIDFFMEGASILKNNGVDAITIADCPLARARVDSSLLACKLKRDLDITPIPHMTCRDRNINATKALLLGLNIEGVENVLVVTGDPVPTPLRDEIKTMFSFNSSVLAKHINELNETVFHKPFGIYGAININAVNFDSQLDRAKKKVENGVKVLFTQPVLTREAFENLKRIKTELNVKVMGGIIPVVSYKNACFMNSEISGINVSEDIIKRYEGIDREEASKLAVEISCKVASEIQDYVDGFYIITPFKRVDIVTQIVTRINNGL